MQNNLNLTITLRAINHLTAPLQRLNNQLQELQAPVKNLGLALNTSLQLTGLKSIGEGLNGLKNEAAALTVKLTALASAVGFAFNHMFINVAAEYENLRVSLESIEGGAEKGQQAMAWITDFAKKTPLELDTTTRAYIRLKNAGIDPTNGSLMALVDANAKLNGNQENMLEITNQVSQSWMKNKLQMEEVRIITERGIPVIGLLAKTMHKSETAIIDMMGKGKLGRKEIKLLFAAISEYANGAAEKQSRTWTGMLSTLSDTWKGFVDVLMNSDGAFSFLKTNLDAVINKLAYLQTPEGMKDIEVYGKKLRIVLEKIVYIAGKGQEKINQLSTAVGGFENLAKLALIGVAAVMAGPLLLAITNVAAGLAIVTSVFMANPILLAISAIGLAITGVILNWDILKDRFLTGIENITRWLKEGILLTLEAAVDGLTGIVRIIKDIFPTSFSFNAPESNPAPSSRTHSSLLNPASGKPVTPIFGNKLPLVTGGNSTKTNIGGSLDIKITSDRQVKVTNAKSYSPLVPINVDSGLYMANGY